MENIINCVAGAAQRGPEDPEWSYLEAETFPMLEVKGYKVAKAFNRIKSGERNLELVCSDLRLGTAEIDIMSSVLSQLASNVTFKDVSLFSNAVVEAMEEKNEHDLSKWLEMGYPASRPCPAFDGERARSITALHYAIDQNFSQGVCLLIDAGADPYIFDSDGDSPLSFALREGQLNLVEKLIERGGNEGAKRLQDCICYINNVGRHPLDHLFNSKNNGGSPTRILELLAKQCVKLLNVTPNSDTLVRLNLFVTRSIESEDIAPLRSLVKMGWNCNDILTNLTPETPPLHFACNRAKYEVAKFLIDEGLADPNKLDSRGQPAILHVCLGTESNEEMAVFLVDKGADVTTVIQDRSLLLIAAMKEWRGLFTACLRHGGDLLTLSTKGRLITVTAAQSGWLWIFEAIYDVLNAEGTLSLATIVNQTQPSNGLWPLFMSVYSRHHDITDFLLFKMNANPNLQEPDHKRTCLHYAILNGDLISCKLLVKAGADVSIRSEDRQSCPLDFAINQNNRDIAIFLVEECGADIHSPIEPGVPGSPKSIQFAQPDLQAKLIQAAENRCNSLRSTGASAVSCAGEAAVTATGSESSSRFTFESVSSPARESQPTPSRTSTTSTTTTASSSRFSPSAATTTTTTTSTGSSSRFTFESAPSPAREPQSSPSAPSPLQTSVRSRIQQIQAGATKSAPARTQQPSVLSGLTPQASPESTIFASGAGEKNTSEQSKTSATCVVCFENPINSAFIHGDEGHVYCCFRCARMIKDRGDKCPICRQKIDAVVKTNSLS